MPEERGPGHEPVLPRRGSGCPVRWRRVCHGTATNNRSRSRTSSRASTCGARGCRSSPHIVSSERPGHGEHRRSLGNTWTPRPRGCALAHRGGGPASLPGETPRPEPGELSGRGEDHDMTTGQSPVSSGERSDQCEYLTLAFSPTSAPLRSRWRNNGLSADFLGDYVTTFLPTNGPEPALAGRQNEIKHAVTYIANEL